MDNIGEIEAAIERLSPPQVEELSGWLEAFRRRPTTPSHVESWLQGARGAAIPGETTAKIMALTRGDD